VDLIPLVSTAVGAAIALGGTVIADLARGRDTRSRDDLAARKAAYLEFSLALGTAVQKLREVAGSGLAGEERIAATNAGLAEAGIYPARERMLMSAPASVMGPAEATFDGLVAVRDAVRLNATTKSREYHDAYHPYEDQMWRLRNAIRVDLGAHTLSPSDLARDTWENRDKCAVCAGVPAQARPVGNP
jgi:hypothetical protein